MVNIRDNLTLKACRVIADLKAETLANAVGVSVDTLYKWEGFKSYPTIQQMHDIVQCFADYGFYVDIGDIKFFKPKIW